MEVQQNDVVENQTVPVLVLTDTGIQRVAFWLRILGGGNRHSQFDPIHVMERVIAPQDDTTESKEFSADIAILTSSW